MSMLRFLDNYISDKLNKTQKRLLHTCFWLLYLILFGLIWAKDSGDWQRSLIFECWALLPRITAVYLTIYWLLPSFLLQKKYAKFIVWFSLVLLITGHLLYGFTTFGYQLFYPAYQVLSSGYQLYQIIHGIVLINATVIVAITIKVLKYWFQNQQKLQQSEHARVQSELNFLKNQVHPHFFFNTLNNLYGLDIEKSDETPQLILHLSWLMRYMLYETQTSLVPLSNEVTHLHHYIELEKIRYQEGFQVFFQVKGELKDQQLAPLLLLPFVENAFKHGLSEGIEDAWINISLEATADMLTFQIKNSLPKLGVAQRRPSGLGLKNVQQRLHHLYAQAYTLEINNQEQIYTVLLKLPLEAHSNNMQ